MPIKEFRCESGYSKHVNREHYVFEMYFPTNAAYEEAVKNIEIFCPKCLSPSWLVPLVSQTARPKFKGSGFYETDYK